MNTKKTEKLFEAFTELDDDLIENALPKNQDYDVVKPALKIPSWKPWVAGVAVAAAAFGVVFAGFKLFGSGKPGFGPAVEASGDSGAVDNAKYVYMHMDYIVYSSAKDLVDASDIIFEGRVEGISFALLDKQTAMELSENDDPKNGELCTIYEVTTNNGYKNVDYTSLKLRVPGGIKGYRVEEQLALAEKTGNSTIPVMEHPPELNIGEEYMFLLLDFGHDSVSGGPMPTIINNTQTAIPLSDPAYRDSFSGASANDILECLGAERPVADDNFNCEATVTHNNQTISLDKAHAFLVQQDIQDVMANDCVPENLAYPEITYREIEDYGNVGYVIDIVFDDVDAPLANGGEDKKAKTTCHATALIAKKYFPTSFITFSYTSIGADGSTEQEPGGSYILSEKSRDVLMMWAAMENFGEEQNDAVKLFDYYDNQENMPKQYQKDFTLPEFPGAIFGWTQYGIMVYSDDKWDLYKGSPVYGVYLADLNGDGKREICSTVSVGSGIVDDRIYAYDFENGYLYELENRGTSDYSLEIENGELLYVETTEMYQTKNPLKLGHMTCQSTTPGVHHQEHEDHDTGNSHHEVDPGPPTYPATAETHHSELDETHH